MKKIDTGTMIMAALAVVAFFVVMYYVVGGIMQLLTLAAPILLVIALVIDYNTVLNYGKWLIKLVKKDVIMGVGAIVLSVFAYPLVFTYLFARAYMTKKLRDVQADYQTKQQGEYTDYEVIEEEKPLRIDIPPVRPRAEKRGKDSGNSYDNMFD